MLCQSVYFPFLHCTNEDPMIHTLTTEIIDGFQAPEDNVTHGILYLRMYMLWTFRKSALGASRNCHLSFFLNISSITQHSNRRIIQWLSPAPYLGIFKSLYVVTFCKPGAGNKSGTRDAHFVKHDRGKKRDDKGGGGKL